MITETGKLEYVEAYKLYKIASNKQCPHCGKNLNLKTFKEHRRLHYDSNRKSWNKCEGTDSSQAASASCVLEELDLIDMEIDSATSDGEETEQ